MIKHSIDNFINNKNDSKRIEKIRKAETVSHTEIYTNNELYSKGTWLEKTIKTVNELIPLFEDYKKLNILDLGCGVGRNCISIAQKFKNIECKIDCVDILDIAITKLINNAKKYDVMNSINGIVDSVENYNIEPNKYDLIMAISVLEHLSCEAILLKKLNEIKQGTKNNGIVCMIINTNICEYSVLTGEKLEAQFEINIETEKLIDIVQNIFSDWEKIKINVKQQMYTIPREDGERNLTSDVVTFVARRVDRKK